MEFVLFFGLLIYVVTSLTNARKAAAKKEAARARAAAQAAAAERESASVSNESVRTMMPPSVPTSTPRQAPASRLSTPQQRRHVLRPSRDTNHAHMETSMTGFANDCPPGPTAKKSAASRAASAAEPGIAAVDLTAAAQSVFQFDPDRVRDGLIYAEILGKPKALRR